MDSYLSKDLAMFWAEAAEWNYLTAVSLISWLDPYNIKKEDDLSLFDASLKKADVALSHYFSDTEVMVIKTGKKTPIEWLRIFGKCRLSISQNLLAALLNHLGDCPELDFYGHHAGAKKSDKPLTTRQRKTFLIIIAALCSSAKIDPQARGASQRIKELTESLGVPVDDETIRTLLSEIPDALETRMK